MLKKIFLLSLILVSFSVIRCGNMNNSNTGNEEKKIGVQANDFPVDFRIGTLNNAEVTTLRAHGYDQVIFQIINYRHGTKHPEHRHEYGLIAFVNENGNWTKDENLVLYNNNIDPKPMLDQANQPFNLKTANYPYRLTNFNLNTNILLVPQSGSINTTLPDGRNIDFSNYVRFEISPCQNPCQNLTIKQIDSLEKKQQNNSFLDPSPPA